MVYFGVLISETPCKSLQNFVSFVCFLPTFAAFWLQVCNKYSIFLMTPRHEFFPPTPPKTCILFKIFNCHEARLNFCMQANKFHLNFECGGKMGAWTIDMCSLIMTWFSVPNFLLCGFGSLSKFFVLYISFWGNT